MAVCQSPASDGVVHALVETVDCHIRVLVQQSYRDMVGPDTPFALAFTGLLTIYIALLGYQLMFGRGGVRVTDLPLSIVKIGVILAFVTSWAAYQTIFFNVLFEGPRDLAQTLLAPLARAGSGFDGDVYGGLERAYGDMSAAATVYAGQASPSANILQGGPMLGSGLLWLSSIAMLLSTVGVIVAMKIVLAFLLASGPIFIGLMLFERTRGLFDGWLRTTLACALTPSAIVVFSAAMLLMLQPFLAALAANAQQGRFEMGVVITIGLIVAVFAMIAVIGLRVCFGIASGFSSRGRDDRATVIAPQRSETSAPSSARVEQIAQQASGGGGALGRDAEVGDEGWRGGRRVVDAAAALTDITPLSARLGRSYRRNASLGRPNSDGEA